MTALTKAVETNLYIQQLEETLKNQLENYEARLEQLNQRIEKSKKEYKETHIQSTRDMLYTRLAAATKTRTLVINQIESIKIKLEQIEEGGAEFEAEMKEYMAKMKKNQEYWAKFSEN